MKFIRTRDAQARNPAHNKANRNAPPVITVKAGQIIEGDQYAAALSLSQNAPIAPYDDEAFAAVAKLLACPARRKDLAKMKHVYNLRESLTSQEREIAEKLYAAHQHEISKELDAPMAAAIQQLEAAGKTATVDVLKDLYIADDEQIDAAVVDLQEIGADVSVTDQLKVLKGT